MKENLNFILIFGAMMLTIMLLGCETPYDKDDLNVRVEAYANDGECTIIVDGTETEHTKSDGADVSEIIKAAGAVP